MRWAGQVARVGDSTVLTGKRPFGRLKRRWDDNIKMDLQESDLKT